MTQRLTGEQFTTGLLAALAFMGYKTIAVGDTRFDTSMEEAFKELERIADEEDIDVLFRIRTDPIRGDSLAARHALRAAAQRQVISLSNEWPQEAEIRLNRREAQHLLDSLPGGPRVFGRLGNQFLQHYETVPA